METKNIDDLEVGDTVFAIDLAKKIFLTMKVTDVSWWEKDPCFLHIKFDEPFYDINDCGIWCDMDQPIYVNERCIVSTDKDQLKAYLVGLYNLVK